MPVVLGDAARDGERLRLTLPDTVDTVDTVQALTAYLTDHPNEDLVIIGPETPLVMATEMAERYRLDRPTLSVLLLRRRVEMQVLSDALRSGIREVVLADDAQALLEACTRAQSVSRQLRRTDLRTESSGGGKVIMVFSAKGGCGKTTVATNLAGSLSLLGQGRVCLVDLNLEFGDVGIALQVEPVRTISDVLGMQGSLDRRALESLVIGYRDGLDLLLAPIQPADAEFITAPLVGEILAVLAQMYDYIVIDTPPTLNEVVLRCFDVADSHLLLTSLDMLSLKNLKVTLDALDVLGYPRDRWKVILNRCDSRVGLTPQDVEDAIGIGISTRLPSSKDLPSALNSGVALSLERPRHPFSKAMRTLAEMEAVVPSMAGPAASSMARQAVRA
jgi:pilus assembly protein CpaE